MNPNPLTCEDYERDHLSARDEYAEVLRAGSDIHHHMAFLRECAKGNVMEIGVRQGASTAALLAGIEEHDGHLWSVDKNDCPRFPGHPNWTFIQADSVKDKARVKALLPESLEVLFIDGDHSYEAVFSDLITYGDRAKLILLHDVEPPEYGVLTAISDYCADNDLSYEIRHHSFGLGVIRR